MLPAQLMQAMHGFTMICLTTVLEGLIEDDCKPIFAVQLSILLTALDVFGSGGLHVQSWGTQTAALIEWSGIGHCFLITLHEVDSEDCCSTQAALSTYEWHSNAHVLYDEYPESMALCGLSKSFFSCTQHSFVRIMCTVMPGKHFVDLLHKISGSSDPDYIYISFSTAPPMEDGRSLACISFKWECSMGFSKSSVHYSSSDTNPSVVTFLEIDTLEEDMMKFKYCASAILAMNLAASMAQSCLTAFMPH
ncbi:hypothetical protein DACRYDRAFT_18532 [Dacryopinax primogenitus]|uniref:Uncharacterized protein n=1 Tax=Dacryopinax primogenitus (strain DJM 731) TaxID=1858805 RepID=M5FQ62_DACPD|nr:uncharacterized protein DACRYDRAFT_18532 [Dacryopinax primogenitus]EJT97543.1 hypothetical protein DACRYDRAFT_18532 [Dacryopinax primogenitus]